MSEASKAWAYARVSSREQNLDRQLLALQQYVPKGNIVIDRQSGKDLDRAGYQALKGPLGLKPGDTLYIKSLNRLSRNKDDIKKELEWFRENDIRLMIIDLPTSMIQVPDGQSWIIDMINNILIEVLASMAEQERIEIHARQKEGISAAMAKGVTFGRPRVSKPDNFDAIYERVLKKEYTSKRAMTELGLTSYVFLQFCQGIPKGAWISMNATTNDARDNLQFINPARYEDLRHSWEQDILSMFNRPKAASSLCSAGAKQIVSEPEPVVSKYEQMKESVPIHLKAVLTIREAAAYTNIGINKIDALLRSPNCPFVLFVGTKKLVKRKEFEQFISNKLVI